MEGDTDLDSDDEDFTPESGDSESDTKILGEKEELEQELAGLGEDTSSCTCCTSCKKKRGKTGRRPTDFHQLPKRGSGRCRR